MSHPIAKSQRGETTLPPWTIIVGCVFGGIALIFICGLILLAIAGHPIPQGSTYLVAIFLALSAGLSSGFLGGHAVAEGHIPMLGSPKSNLKYGATGGIAAFIIVLFLGLKLIPSEPDATLTTTSDLQAEAKPYVYAFGISNYKKSKNIPPLQYGSSDAKLFASHLERFRGYSSFVLPENECTRDGIMNVLERLKDPSIHTADDRVVIFFSTRGVSISNDRTGSRFGYIIPIDATNVKLSSNDPLKNAVLDLSHEAIAIRHYLRAELFSAIPKEILLVISATHGVFDEQTMVPMELPGKSIQYITGPREALDSFELTNSIGRGFLTHFLIESLRTTTGAMESGALIRTIQGMLEEVDGANLFPGNVSSSAPPLIRLGFLHGHRAFVFEAQTKSYAFFRKVFTFATTARAQEPVGLAKGEDLRPGPMPEEYMRVLRAMDRHSEFNDARGRGERFALQKIKESPVDLHAYYLLAEVYLDMKLPEKAKVNAETALRINPLYADAWGALGLALRRLDEFEEAILNLEEATKIVRSDPQAWNTLGYLYRVYATTDKRELTDETRKRLLEKGLDSLNKAVELKGNLEDEARNLEKVYYYNRGRVYHHLGDFDNALLNYEQAGGVGDDFSVYQTLARERKIP